MDADDRIGFGRVGQGGALIDAGSHPVVAVARHRGADAVLFQCISDVQGDIPGEAVLGVAIVGGRTARVAGFGAASAVGHLSRDRGIGDTVVARVEDDRHTGKVARRGRLRGAGSGHGAESTSTAISPAPARILTGKGATRDGLSQRCQSAFPGWYWLARAVFAVTAAWGQSASDCSERYARVMVSPPMPRSNHAARSPASLNHCSSVVFGPFLRRFRHADQSGHQRTSH